MRLHPMGWALCSILVLAITPAVGRAQVSVRERCIGSWDSCFRLHDFDRRIRDQAFERAARAEERAQRLAETRRDRAFEARIQAESRATARAITMRDLQDRARERQELARARALDRRADAALTRQLRIRPRAR